MFKRLFRKVAQNALGKRTGAIVGNEVGKIADKALDRATGGLSGEIERKVRD